MTVRNLIRAATACALMTGLFSGCGGNSAFNGNMSDITLEPGDTYAVIKVKDYEGEITAKLFPQAAPRGVAKFIEAANMGYYDGKTFHRVLEGMLIQGGALNMDGSDANIPLSEYFVVETSDKARNFHGALCFAKDDKGNYRQFYIVTAGDPVDIDENAAALKAQIDKYSDQLLKDKKKELDGQYKAMTKIPASVKERYKEVGGLFRLDGTVTVFGQVVDGFDILDAIQSVEVVAGNKIDDDNESLGKFSRPLDDIFIDSVTIVEIPKEETESTDKGRGKK
ncbi:MAG: peptidylprolyl isomerase [Oscillospiraceae bacterium]|jgi:cyclophilin family peptidyl-prolyl cis-trans isomerase|nr:peptidylprolyl isomerase [Oscillospiraceae bacterium]